jgi:hypothetical protein
MDHFSGVRSVSVADLVALYHCNIDPSVVVKAKASLPNISNMTFQHLASFALAGRDLEQVVADYRRNPDLDPEKYFHDTRPNQPVKGS